MIGDVRFADLIRISQIRSRPNRSKPQVQNKNFKEFTDVYKEVLSSSTSTSSRLKVRFGNVMESGSNEKYPRRPLHNVKKIHIEMPVLGAERAIVSTPTLKERKSPKKKTATKDESLVTEEQITRWKKKETKPKKDEDTQRDAHLLLKQTKQEIDNSVAQLGAIKTLIDQIKPPEKIRKSKTPTYKAKRKPDRHAECVSKRYLTTLNTMQQKLQKLEEKYFSKPKVVYKNVRDICTTFSDVDLLYEDDSSLANVNIDETLQGIKEELDTIANSSFEKEEKKPVKKNVTFKAPEIELNTVGDTFDEERTIHPTNFSFKKPASFNEDLEEPKQENYARLIDQTESWFKKYTQRFDLEKFYDDISNTDEEENDTRLEACHCLHVKVQKVEEDDNRSIESDKDDSHDSDVDKFYHSGNLNYFNKELREVISTSSYLSKEFDGMKPSVKVFTSSDRYVRNKCFGTSSKASTNAETSITDLIDNLNLSLKDSIYYKAV